MSTARRPAAWLALLALTLALDGAPARAAIEPSPSPEGLGNLLKYSACAISISLSTDPLPILLGAVHCIRALIDEIEHTH